MGVKKGDMGVKKEAQNGSKKKPKMGEKRS